MSIIHFPTLVPPSDPILHTTRAGSGHDHAPMACTILAEVLGRERRLIRRHDA
jgi:hypothetical protein